MNCFKISLKGVVYTAVLLLPFLLFPARAGHSQEIPLTLLHTSNLRAYLLPCPT